MSEEYEKEREYDSTSHEEKRTGDWRSMSKDGMMTFVRASDSVRLPQYFSSNSSRFWGLYLGRNSSLQVFRNSSPGSLQSDALK